MRWELARDSCFANITEELSAAILCPTLTRLLVHRRAAFDPTSSRRHLSGKDMKTQTGHLKEISPDEIKRNPDNPRLFFRPEEMDTLLASIRLYGIQVPIAVYEEWEPLRFD